MSPGHVMAAGRFLTDVSVPADALQNMPAGSEGERHK